MTFWIIVALMLGLGIAVLAFEFLRKRPDLTSNQREQNLLLAKEKLAELDQEKAAGNIDEETYAQAKEELETGLLEDTEVEEVVARVQPASARLAAVAVALLVPVLSVGIYMKLGSPQYVERSGTPTPGMQNPHAMNNDGKTPTMEELLRGLEERVQQTPDDAEGWFMLGRVYQSMNRFPEAAKAYEQLRKLTDDHPQALIALADTLAMVQGGKISGRPYDLVRQALDKAPDDPTALWLAGKGAVEAADYQNAVYYWRRAEAALADNADFVRELRNMIAQVKQAAAQAGTELDDPGSAVGGAAAQPAAMAQPAAAGAAIELSVSLAPELQDKVNPGDRLFIFAKQVQGPPMPVAAVRITAGDLPAKLVINDGNMLQQGTKLADYQQLVVAARIAKGSQPSAASGDLQSAEITVSVADGKPVELVIDQIVP
ncbi:c-type cytochrome biogenesis protein CcmI [Thiolapillus sp.]